MKFNSDEILTSSLVCNKGNVLGRFFNTGRSRINLQSWISITWAWRQALCKVTLPASRELACTNSSLPCEWNFREQHCFWPADDATLLAVEEELSCSQSGWKLEPKSCPPCTTSCLGYVLIDWRAFDRHPEGHSEPAHTSAPSIGCLLLLSYGWTSNELVYGFTLVTDYVRNRSHI
jgi:hypothetical protein